MNKIIAFSLAIALSLAITGNAWAQTKPTSTSSATVKPVTSTTKQVTLREKIASRSALIKERLAGAKLQACEKVEQSLTTRSNKMSASMTKHLGVLEKLQEKIGTLAAKRIGQGKTINGYAALVTAANESKATAASAIGEVKDPPAIDCSSDNPKAAVTEFKTSFKSAREALHNYHRALRNLRVAVASVTGQENRSATSSAKPATSSSTTR